MSPVMFTKRPSYSINRALRLDVGNPCVGEDVFALQTALEAQKFTPGQPDGIFGVLTDSAVRRYQRASGLLADGIAGPLTKRDLSLRCAQPVVAKYALPTGLIKGQVYHESSANPGCYSELHEDGSWDAGLVQTNSRFTDPATGFNVPVALGLIGHHTREKFAEYVHVKDERERWGLAAGAWNAPAYTDFLAGVGGTKPSAAAEKLLRDYIASVTAYMAL